MGFLEADQALTPKEAFLRAAAELVARGQPEFDPEKLEIFKLVQLRSAQRSKIRGIVVPSETEAFRVVGTFSGEGPSPSLWL